MTKEVHNELFSLLLKVYNYTIHTYYHFPEVILYGKQHLEKVEFDRLLAEEMIVQCHADSFGKSYRLSKKAEAFLVHAKQKRRRRVRPAFASFVQGRFSFTNN